MSDLSPAAQAVLSGWAASEGGVWLEGDPDRLAAALRALADHQRAPIQPGQPLDHWDPDERTRRELRNLAAELEGLNP